MFALALRRQLVLAVIAVSLPGVGVGLFLLCLVPAIFASSIRVYRIAAAVLASLLTWSGIVFATGIGQPSFVPHWPWLLPAAAVAWLTTWPVRQLRSGHLADAWIYAGPWPASATWAAKREHRRQQRIRRIASMR